MATGRWSRARRHHPSRRWFRGHGYFKRLGPGIVTGAADDDPSGIGTYSQVGASHGLTLLWTAPFLLPLAAAVQEATARLALVTGEGLGALVRNRFPRWILWIAVLLVASANTLNIGADLASMGAAVHLLVPIPAALGVAAFAAIILGLEVWIPYERYSKVLRWFALSLAAYVITLAVVDVDWPEVLRNTFLPSLGHLNAADMAALTALAGTTISPYLFFWQAAEEVEEREEHASRSRVTRSHLIAMRVDVWAGMISGVVAMFAIMTTAAVTIGAKGGMNISTAEQAASALEPLAGSFAKVLFAAGIIGLGMLAVPVLAGSTAYAVAEAFQWNEGLSKRLKQAPGFYGVIIGSMVLGLVLDAVGIDPIRALYYAAIFNGVTAPPIILLILLLVRSRRLMGSRRAGWLSTAGIGFTGVVMTAFPLLALLLR
jgi:NRAMP (natural resistance-associated macrophage protein)-like metal ion transporter